VSLLEEIERFEKAIRLVERFEGYLFRRALGIALIICGIVFPLSAFMFLNAQAIANLLNMGIQSFLTFIPTIILLVGMAIIIYNFTSAHVLTSKMQEKSIWKDAPHMVLMFLVWFTAFFLTSYVPEPFTIVSWLWAGGGASLLSYLLMRRDPTDIKFTELPIIGLICLLTSLPLLFIREEQLVLTTTFLAFSLSFITGGLYSILNASKMLGGEP
jgi:hypothetical protein